MSDPSSAKDPVKVYTTKGEPEVLENPEFNGGVNAPDSPIHEEPEFNGGVNGEPETQEELPEFNGGVNGEPEIQEELPEFNGGVNGEPELQPDLPEFNGGVNGELPDPAELPKVQLIITKWTDEQGNELKPADAKAPSVPGEVNEAFEHGEIEGYVFVRTETKDDVVIHVFRKVSPATPSDDTNRRPDTVISDEVPATQSQAVLPNTGTQEDRATDVLGVLSLIGTVGLLFAKKKKDDEEEA